MSLFFKSFLSYGWSGWWFSKNNNKKPKNDLSCNQSEWRGNPVLYFRWLWHRLHPHSTPLPPARVMCSLTWVSSIAKSVPRQTLYLRGTPSKAGVRIVCRPPNVCSKARTTWKTVSMIKLHDKKKKGWKHNWIFYVFESMEPKRPIKNQNASFKKRKDGRKDSKMSYGCEGHGMRMGFGARPPASSGSSEKTPACPWASVFASGSRTRPSPWGFCGWGEVM